MQNAAAEQRLLKLSIAVTIVVSAFGVLFGLLSGSMSIMFDGVFSAIDAAMSGLALFVSRLVTRVAENRRFQFGYWHIEPMVLAFNGGTLMLLCFYAFLNAVDSLLAGGRQLDFDWAMAYAVLVCVVCFGMFFYERHLNRRIGSDFVRLDAQSWLMSGAITSALLVAFAIAGIAEGNGLRVSRALCRPGRAGAPDAGPRLRADPHGAQGAAGDPADHAARTSTRVSVRSWTRWSPVTASRPTPATSPRWVARSSSRSTSPSRRKSPIDSVGEADAIRREICRGDRRRGSASLAHDRLHRRSEVAVDAFDLLGRKLPCQRREGIRPSMYKATTRAIQVTGRAAISAGPVGTGEVAICLVLQGAHREQERCRGAVAQPALEDHRRARPPPGGQGSRASSARRRCCVPARCSSTLPARRSPRRPASWAARTRWWTRRA